MLNKSLTPEQTNRLCAMLLRQDNQRYYVMVSIGGKVGSGHLIGANEGEPMMRPFDPTLSDDKSKDIVPAEKSPIGSNERCWMEQVFPQCNFEDGQLL